MLEVISPEKYMQMYNEYKEKLASKPYNKWDQFKIEMPLNLAKEIESRIPSYR